MKKLSIYICGPIDREGFVAQKDLFTDAQNVIISNGYVCCNPLRQFYLGNWGRNVIRGLMMLQDCDGICLLEGWDKYYGSKIEYLFARKMGLYIFHIENNELILN